ncbi:hypothetical protein NPIL_152531 [Nephila pilipes]|uniref:Uncharacterized protein n=1 Tax=Nephila pilipes TaxID=299642 RepID=A0A8X6PBX0_NEPPI|nr:hypothetical protein NPIL_152531 [Nephila pilipes]
MNSFNEKGLFHIIFLEKEKKKKPLDNNTNLSISNYRLYWNPPRIACVPIFGNSRWFTYPLALEKSRLQNLERNPVADTALFYYFERHKCRFFGLLGLIQIQDECHNFLYGIGRVSQIFFLISIRKEL